MHVWPSCFGPQVLFTQAIPMSQSAFVVQVVVQAPFAQRNGLQFWTAGGSQVPRPSQTPGVFRRLPEQVAAMQIVSRAYFSQPPTPSHRPFWPQLDGPASMQIFRVSATSASSGQQVPSRPIRAQDRHGPLQMTLQQTPSAQKPDAQSAGLSQAAPFMRGPQLPPTHWWPLVHWLLAVQVLKQSPVVELQEKGTQMRVEPGLHCPLPSQTFAPITASPSHVPGLQTVFTGHLLQAPMPSHFPSSWQVETSDALQLLGSRGLDPIARFTQVPVAQVLHPSVQALSQQTPSTQWPPAHSASQPHASLTPLLPWTQGAVSGPTSRASVATSVITMPSPFGPSDASGLELPFLQPAAARRAIAIPQTANRPPAARGKFIFSLGETTVPEKAPRYHAGHRRRYAERGASPSRHASGRGSLGYFRLRSGTMTRVAYPVAAHGKSLAALLVLGTAVLGLGCKAGVVATMTGTGGAGGAIAGTAGTVGSGGRGPGTGGGGPGIGGFGGITTNPDAGACQQAQYTFEPKIPTVYLVVDRSGSMFHCLSTTELVCSNKADSSWSKLKDAIEGVITSLDAQVRFGFTTIFGTNPAGGGSCPLVSGTLADNVAPALNNAAAIKTLYDGLAWPNPNDASNTGKKFESPAMYAITATSKALMADTTPGDKYIIFITDGQEDYCDDALEICASDSTVGAIQAAFASAANVHTIVFGLQTTQFNLPGAVLQAFANAGAGEPTVASVPAGLDATAIFDQCQGVTPWRTDLTASGHPQTRGPTAVVGTYMATKGPTVPFQPNASDQTMLTTQLAAALSGVKSCTFDLSSINGKSISVDLNQLNKASVVIEGTTISLDGTNGWSMATATQLVLNGSACDAWRDPNAKNIAFNFPCEIIVE